MPGRGGARGPGRRTTSDDATSHALAGGILLRHGARGVAARGIFLRHGTGRVAVRGVGWGAAALVGGGRRTCGCSTCARRGSTCSTCARRGSATGTPRKTPRRAAVTGAGVAVTALADASLGRAGVRGAGIAPTACGARVVAPRAAHGDRLGSCDVLVSGRAAGRRAFLRRKLLLWVGTSGDGVTGCGRPTVGIGRATGCVGPPLRLFGPAAGTFGVARCVTRARCVGALRHRASIALRTARVDDERVVLARAAMPVGAGAGLTRVTGIIRLRHPSRLDNCAVIFGAAPRGASRSGPRRPRPGPR